MEKKKQYLDVNVPRSWESFFEELLEKPEIKAQVKGEGFTLTYSGLGVWIIHKFLLDHVPTYRFQRVNTIGNRISIFDLKLRRIADIYVKGKEIYCQLCDSTQCEHIEYALTLPDVSKTLKEKGVIT
jgi:hypothetical protein